MTLNCPNSHLPKAHFDLHFSSNGLYGSAIGTPATPASLWAALFPILIARDNIISKWQGSIRLFLRSCLISCKIPPPRPRLPVSYIPLFESQRSVVSFHHHHCSYRPFTHLLYHSTIKGSLSPVPPARATALVGWELSLPRRPHRIGIDLR